MATVCRSGAFLVNGTCQPKCPQGYYVSESGSECVASCKRAAVKKGDLGYCVSSCPAGANNGIGLPYQTQTVCQCRLFNVDGSSCTSSCPVGAIESDGRCLCPALSFGNHCVRACKSGALLESGPVCTS